MMSLFTVALIIALNLIPDQVSSFTMQMKGVGNENKRMHFTLQEDGGWRGVEHPKDHIGTFYLDSEKLIIKGEGNEHSINLSSIFALEAEAEWSQLNEVRFGSKLIRINRLDNGLDISLVVDGGEPEEQAEFEIRWITKKD